MIPLLQVKLWADYPGRRNVLDGLELAVNPGEVVGLVGESGSGKSTAALAILKLLEFKGGSVRGDVWFRCRNLVDLTERQMRSIRGREIALVLQSPQSSLNPAMRIGAQFLESWRAHESGRGKATPDWLELLEMVHLPGDRAFLDRYPRQLSVGQAQRVLIAMSIVHRPALLIADEATSALDAVTQSEILKLLSELNRQFGMGVLYISHDLLSVASFCDRIAILREGRVVECDRTEEIFLRARHAYTRSLLAAIPKLPAARFHSQHAFA